MSRSAADFLLERVSVRFGRLDALSGVDLRVAPGEAVGFVGPSGSGKTTLLRVLGGMLRPSEGTVTLGGQNLASLSRAGMRSLRSSIGFVHQDLSLIPNLRVSHNVIAGRLGTRSFWSAARSMLFPHRTELEEVHGLLGRVGIADKLFERTDRLSGGQRQRVAVARALHQDPNALLADEPVASVDPARARDTVDLLTTISREEGLTLCISLHNIELAREFLPRLVGLRGGRVVFDKSRDQVTDEEFHALYDLRPEEMLVDGA